MTRRVILAMVGLALALPAGASARSLSVRSFDGTKLHLNFFTAVGLRHGHRAPTVLMGPGWSSAGDTHANDSTVPSVGTVHAPGGRHQLRDPAPARHPGEDALVLRRPWDLSHQPGQDVPHRHRHDRLAGPLPARQTEGQPRPGVSVGRPGWGHTGPDYPLAAATPLSATGSGTLTLSATGGSGPAPVVPSAGPLAAAVAPITPAKAANAINVTVPAPARTALVVGAPKLSLTYRGLSGTGGPVITSVYAQVMDDATGKLLGNQVTPIQVTLDGATHSASLPLEIVSATDRPGEHFTVQVVASTVDYQTQRATGAIDFSNIHVVLPTVNPAGTPPRHPRPNPAAHL